MNRTLFLNYYIDNNKQRQDEIYFCLEKNMKNEHIHKIVLLCENYIVVPNAEKITKINVDKRPTYEMFFDIANEFEGIKIVSNSDIYFDETIIKTDILKENQVFALCVWDFKSNGELRFRNDLGSQDTWIYTGKLDKIDANFPLGFAGCDHCILYQLEKSGVQILSPSEQIRAIHYHLSGVRHYDSTRYTQKNRDGKTIEYRIFDSFYQL